MVTGYVVIESLNNNGLSTNADWYLDRKQALYAMYMGHEVYNYVDGTHTLPDGLAVQLMEQENTDNRTMAGLAKEALAVQDACNLSGVVHAFSRSIRRLRELAKAEGIESTDAINRHCICTVWAIAIGRLTGIAGCFSDVDSAGGYTSCKMLASVNEETTDEG